MTEATGSAAKPSVVPDGTSELPDTELPDTAVPDTAVPDNGASNLSSGTVCIDGGGLIVQSESGWLLHVGLAQVTLPAETATEIVAQRFAGLCEDVKGAHKRCVLGLASNECFFADFELPESIDAKDRSAVSFELERHFPLDAEAMVCDYSVAPSSLSIAAIAIETDRHRSILAALEALGVEVVSIIPSSVLIARSVQRWTRRNTPFTMLLFASASTEQLSVDSNGVWKWRHFFGSDDDLYRNHAVTADLTDESPQSVVIVDRKQLGFRPAGSVQWCELTAMQLAAHGTNVVLSGRWGRWPDLRRGALAPRDPLFAVAAPLRRLAITALLCLVVVAIAVWQRNQRIDRQSQAIRQQQRALYATAFPDRQVPVMLMRSVRSEHSKVLGTRGRGDVIQLPVPATTVLRTLFSGLQHAQQSGGVRLRLVDLKIDDGRCTLTVRATDAVQIGTIAKSLETVGFRVTPPASEQIDPSKEEPIPTYQSTISAVWNPAADQTQVDLSTEDKS